MDGEDNPRKRLRLMDGTGCGGEEEGATAKGQEESYGSIENSDDEDVLQQRLTTEDLVLGGDHYVHITGASTKHNYNLRWYERLGSNCTPSASYCFEVNYNADVDDLFMTTQWQYLPYSISQYDRYIALCVVKSVSSPISSIVTEGDVVLRVNSQDLVQRPGDGLSLGDLTQRLFQRNNTRIIRFLRVSAHTHSSLSVAEVLLYLDEKNAPARFTCKYLSRGTAIAKPVLESTYVDSQLPLSVKKVLQGNRVSWQNVPNLPVAPALAGAALVAANTTASNPPTGPGSMGAQSTLLLQGVSMLAPTVAVHALEKFDNKHHRNVSSYSVRSGLYRDRGKFVVIFSATVQLASGSAASGEGGSAKEKVLYNLGRYDTEEEAARVLNEAKESSKASGGIFLPRHYLHGFRNAVIATAPPAPVQATGNPPGSTTPATATATPAGTAPVSTAGAAAATAAVGVGMHNVSSTASLQSSN